MKILCSILLLSFVACSVPPLDPNIPETNNHMRIEMELKGETSVGMQGIIYSNREDLKDVQLIFPPIYKGSIEMWSDRCGHTFTESYNQGEYLAIDVKDLLAEGFDTRCTYKIRRRVYGADNNMIGYFGINYFSKYTPLVVSIGNRKFTGIAHLQVREGDSIPTIDIFSDEIMDTDSSLLSIDESKVLKIYPTSKKGQIIIKGGNACSVTYPNITYDLTVDGALPYVTLDLAKVFTKFTTANSCDYEIIATATDSVKMEELMLMINVYKKETMWLEPPILSTNILGQLDALFMNPYIMGISIDSKTCINQSNCAKKCKEDDACTIRAITRSGRFFYGKVKNSKWIEIQ